MVPTCHAAGSCALWVPVRAPRAHPRSGVGTWREGFPALSKGQAGDLTLHSWKLGQGPGPPAPYSTPGAAPRPGEPLRALMEGALGGPPRARGGRGAALRAAWHLALLRWGHLAHPGSSTLRVASPRGGASSSKRGVRGLGRRAREPPRPREAPQSMLVLTEREMLSVCAETEMSSWSTGLW